MFAARPVPPRPSLAMPTRPYEPNSKRPASGEGCSLVAVAAVVPLGLGDAPAGATVGATRGAAGAAAGGTAGATAGGSVLGAATTGVAAGPARGGPCVLVGSSRVRASGMALSAIAERETAPALGLCIRGFLSSLGGAAWRKMAGAQGARIAAPRAGSVTVTAPPATATSGPRGDRAAWCRRRSGATAGASP